MNNIPKAILKSGKDDALKRFHPWVFSGAIKKIYGEPQEGHNIEVYSNHDEFLGIGHYQAKGSIAVRVFSFEKLVPDYAFWKAKLAAAYDFREKLGLTNNSETNVYRLVHAEGDGLPGLIIDFYNGTLVIQSHSAGMHLIREVIADALKEIYKEKLQAVYYKSGEPFPNNEKDCCNYYLFGKILNNEVSEYGHKFFVDWELGQKTGFFIDQRENRRLLEKYAKDKTVLNTFSYTGGFSVYALMAGASEVHSVDSSKKAVELIEKNIEKNNIDAAKHKSFCADAIDFLNNIDNRYDMIILDPPAFAKHQSSKYNALQGYKRINLQAIKQIKKGGIIFTFSCSQVVDRYLFYSTVVSAAILSGRKVKILHQLSQPADHPVSAFHPEGEYLKGIVLFVE